MRGDEQADTCQSELDEGIMIDPIHGCQIYSATAILLRAVATALSGPGCVYLHAISAVYIVHIVRATADRHNNDCSHSGYLCVRFFTFFTA